MKTRNCPECGSGALYVRKNKVSPRNNSPYYLEGLGGFLQFAKFKVVVCGDCGLMRFFADEEARSKLPQSSHWIPFER